MAWRSDDAAVLGRSTSLSLPAAGFSSASALHYNKQRALDVYHHTVIIVGWYALQTPSSKALFEGVTGIEQCVHFRVDACFFNRPFPSVCVCVFLQGVPTASSPSAC